MNRKWVSFSPHILSGNSTTKTYITMILLLCPVLANAIIMVNFNVLLTVVVAVLSAFLTDLIFKIIVDKNFNFEDVSAIFIGFVIGLCMPTGANPFICVLGTVFSMLFIRNIAGGIGKNIVSEIAVAVVLTSLIFPKSFYLFVDGGRIRTANFLTEIMAGGVEKINLENLLFGAIAGSIAQTSLFWLLIAGVALILFRVVDFRVPIAVLVSTFLFSYLFFDLITAINLIFAGEVILVAFFIATDYAVVPQNKWIKYLYGIMVGLITVLIWKCGNYQLGIYYAVIIVGLGSSMFSGILKKVNFRRA